MKSKASAESDSPAASDEDEVFSAQVNTKLKLVASSTVFTQRQTTQRHDCTILTEVEIVPRRHKKINKKKEKYVL